MTSLMFGPTSVREIRAVFSPTDDSPEALTPVRAIAVMVHDDTELTVELTGTMEQPAIGGLTVDREEIEVSSFARRSGLAEYVAGRMSGLMTMAARITGPDPDGVRVTRRTREDPVPVEDLLPGMPTAEAVATLVQDRDFVHRRVQAVEAELARRMAELMLVGQERAAERQGWADANRAALADRDRWRRVAKKRKRSRDAARAEAAEARAIIAGTVDGYNLNARDAHNDGPEGE